MKPSLYEQLALDRERAHAEVLKAERRDRDLARMRHELAGLELDLAALRLQRALRLKYRPDQPRVPAGQPGGGQWTDGGSNSNTGTNQVSRALRLAEVIRVCVVSGVSRTVSEYGIKTYKATYECPGGQTITREGFGHSPPGLVRDPFQ